MAAGLMLLGAAQAEPVSKLKPTDYVNDFAHVLDQNTIAQMDDICHQVEEKAHARALQAIVDRRERTRILSALKVVR